MCCDSITCTCTIKIVNIVTQNKITIVLEFLQNFVFFSAADADGMANSVGPDQTAPFRSSLFCVSTVSSDLSVPILIIITVIMLVLITGSTDSAPR